MSRNVLYFGGFKLPDKNAAAHRVLSVSKLFNKLGYDVYLLGQHDDAHVQQKVQIDKSEYQQIKMYTVKYPSGMIQWLRYIISIKNVKKFCEIYKPEIVVFYNYPAVAQLRAGLYCKKKGIKFLADTTEWYIPTDKNLVRRLIKFIDTELRMRFVNKRLNGNIVISPYLADFYKNYHQILLPPVIDSKEPKWQKIKGNLRSDDQSDLKFIYAGQLGGKKDNMFKIFNILENIRNRFNFSFELHLAGIDEDMYRKNIDSQIFPFLIFHGRLSHEHTLKLVSQSDYVVFYREINKVNMAGFPTKFVEAFECGTPVITNLSSNLDDYLIDGKNGYVLDENIENKLLTILKNGKNGAQEMKKKLKESNIFDLENYVKEFKNFTENL